MKSTAKKSLLGRLFSHGKSKAGHRVEDRRAEGVSGGIAPSDGEEKPARSVGAVLVRTKCLKQEY
jgi:hypothetical protein